MQGLLFDRAPIIDAVSPLWATGGPFESAKNNVGFVKGSFFEQADIPPAMDGDVYLMRYILHDHNHANCLKILSNLRHAMEGKDATLMIGESAIPDRHHIAPIDVVTKIDMLMLNILGGIERTPAMWKELLEEAGFEIKAIHGTRSPVHFVEAVLKK